MAHDGELFEALADEPPDGTPDQSSFHEEDMMAVMLTVRDETTTGSVYNEVPLEFPSERVTVRELIRERVYQEVQDFNLQSREVFRGLVQPTETEIVLNGGKTEYRMKKHRQIEWRPQYEKAVEAFTRSGFLILIDNQQAESLDQEFVIRSGTEVSFLRLTLLVGG